MVTEFIALRSKCYSLKTLEKEVKKCKGIKSNIIKTIAHDEFIECIDGKKISIEQTVFKSVNHQIITSNVLVRDVISADDSKRILDKDNNFTIPIGFKDL
jgi:hypothetical protein